MGEVTHTLTITGMTCGGCSGRVLRVLKATPGVLRADISHAVSYTHLTLPTICSV